jgi:hypothetical protein
LANEGRKLVNWQGKKVKLVRKKKGEEFTSEET